MTAPAEKDTLLAYLQDQREALLWKLEGLPEYDVRRPLTGTGTNLLGLVKHVAGVEIGYFADTFGRPFADPPAWVGSEDGADMWATAQESREQITDLYRRVWAHSDATIGALPLDAPGRVPWWPPERAEVTLHRVLVHMVAETARHAGHADIIRETIDGGTGVRAGRDNMAPLDAAGWTARTARIEQAAREAARD